MKFTGRVFVFGDDIDTDAIIPARYLNKSDPEHLKAHCMEDADPTFPEKVKPGDIIVAGKNFGCGSSREHAPLLSKPAGYRASLPSPLPGSSTGTPSTLVSPFWKCPLRI